MTIHYVCNGWRRKILKEKPYFYFNKDCTVEEIFITDVNDNYKMNYTRKQILKIKLFSVIKWPDEPKSSSQMPMLMDPGD